MKQGVLTNGRVRLLLSKGHSCYRPRRDVSNRILKKLTDLIILKIKPVYLYRENASASLSVDVLLTATWLFSTWPSSRRETMRSLDSLIIPSLGLSFRETISFIYQIHTLNGFPFGHQFLEITITSKFLQEVGTQACQQDQEAVQLDQGG